MPVNRDQALAFGLLDKDKRGYLRKSEAITWVRTRGCCASDQEIERFLLNRVKTNTDGSPRFTLPLLIKVDEIYAATVAAGQPLGPDHDKLSRALSIACGNSDGDDQISILDLREALMSYSLAPMSSKDCEAFLRTIKLPRKSDLISSEDLATLIIQTIQQ
jgi:hypothetical protein